MRTSDPALKKYKKVCNNFPNIAILTKSAMPGEVQLMFVHASVGNKYLGGYVSAFALTGSLDSPSVVSIDINIAFATDGDKICLLITEVLLCAAAGNLASSNKQRDWTPRNAVLLPPFLTEAAILDRETVAEDIIKIFTHSIVERAGEREEDDGSKDNKDSEGGKEAEEETKNETVNKKQSIAKTLATITENCDDVLDFLQAVAFKSPRITAAPLSLRADKRARVWFRRWSKTNLPTPSKTDLQDHTSITVALSYLSTRFQTAEAL